MGRAPCCDKVGLKKGPWTPEEDQKLVAYIQEHGHGSWRALPQKAGLLRCGKSCRLRWANYLRPDIKRGKFSVQEEQTIIQLHALLGNRWSAIATHLPKRTDNEIKNYWNTHLKKRLVQMGIDPVTHKPQSETGHGTSSSHVSHMAQWESARLEAESRLVRESKLRANALSFSPLNTAHIFNKFAFDATKVEGNTWMKAVQKFEPSASFTVPYEEDRTSYLSLLQQAMCPSAQATKLLYDETKKMVATHKIHEVLNNASFYIDEKKPVVEKPQDLMVHSEERSVDSSAVHSGVSEPEPERDPEPGLEPEFSKTDGEDSHDVLDDFRRLHSSSCDEISSIGFKANYDGFTTDMLMDLVVVPPTLSTSAEDRSIICDAAVAAATDDSKDYWSNMFTLCNSPHSCNHVGVQSMF